MFIHICRQGSFDWQTSKEAKLLISGESIKASQNFQGWFIIRVK